MKPRSLTLAVLAGAASAVQLQPAHPLRTPSPCHRCRVEAAAAESATPIRDRLRQRAAEALVVKEDTWLTEASASAVPMVSSVLEPIRAAAVEELKTSAFPRRKDEAWRRCDLSSLRAATVVAPTAGAASSEAVAEVLAVVANDDATAGMRLVLVDGVCSAELSDLSRLPEGVQVGSIADVDGAAREHAMATLTGPLPETGADARTQLGMRSFAALNQAALADAATVHVPDGVVVDEPLHIVIVSSGEGGKEGAVSASHPSLTVRLGEGASLRLLQQYAGAPGAAFVNAVSRVELGARSYLEHSYAQEQSASTVHVDSVVVDVGAEASYRSQLLASGGRLSRVNQLVNLNAGGAHSELFGMTLATESQLIDMHSRVVHVSPDCTSEQEQRNALAGRARGVFKGAVVVPVGSDNTTANQLCRTLLLSDDA